jgi:hypothetical protein
MMTLADFLTVFVLTRPMLAVVEGNCPGSWALVDVRVGGWRFQCAVRALPQNSRSLMPSLKIVGGGNFRGVPRLMP